MSDSHTLLLCTVGGTPAPVIASLKHWRPSRVLFVVSPQTRPDVEASVLPAAARDGFTLPVGCYDFVTVDAQDITACVRALRDATPAVQAWLDRGPGYDVVIDYTGGTKTMSAALALLAHPWGCRFSYVGGSERTKNDVGVVVDGKEMVLHVRNPWEALGLQALADAATLFDRGAYTAARQILDSALARVQDPGRKRELSALKLLAEACDLWDRFQHKDAAGKLADLAKYDNDLRALLGPDRGRDLVAWADRARAALGTLVDQEGATFPRVLDLLANAQRRAAEGRHDDAVARLYRALEALAQVRLREAHGLPRTAEVPLDRVPEPLRTAWAPRAAADGTLMLGLQNDYDLLLALGDPLGLRFQQLGLNDRERSPLTARNQSILAHGFEPATAKAFQALGQAALRLAEIDPSSLPAFPRLAGPLTSPGPEGKRP